MTMLRIYRYFLVISSFNIKLNDTFGFNEVTHAKKIYEIQYPGGNCLFSLKYTRYYNHNISFPTLFCRSLYLIIYENSLGSVLTVACIESALENSVIFVFYKIEYQLSTLVWKETSKHFKHHLSFEMLIMFVLNNNSTNGNFGQLKIKLAFL